MADAIVELVMTFEHGTNTTDYFVPRCCSWHVPLPLGYHGKRLYFDSSGRLV